MLIGAFIDLKRGRMFLMAALLKIPRAAYVAMPIVFLFFHGAGMLLLSNTAHNGGRLVHRVHALVTPTPGQPGVQPASPEKNEDHHGKRGEGE